MSRFRARLTDSERTLLESIEKLAAFYDFAKRPRNIHLSLPEFGIWQRILRKFQQQALIDRMAYVRHINRRNGSYRGYSVRPISVAMTEETQRDLMEFDR